VAAQDGVRPPLNVIVLGPPGAGKGTQSERLSLSHGLLKISTGDILREAVQSRTELGCSARAAMEAGNLVSDEVMIGIVRTRLSRDDVRSGFILDGFPRTVIQATALDRIMDERGPLVVLDIVVPEEALVRRLAARRICSKCGTNAPVDSAASCPKCGGTLIARVDDQVDVVRERLKVYQRQTKPLVDYYSTRGTFRTIDGDQAPDIVAAAVREALSQAVTAGRPGL
jgi:adenylate kinase